METSKFKLYTQQIHQKKFTAQYKKKPLKGKN